MMASRVGAHPVGEPALTDILKQLDVNVRCEQCGEFSVSAAVIAESQHLLVHGCPGSPHECPAELFATLVDSSALESLVKAWEQFEKNARDRCGRALVVDRPHITISLEKERPPMNKPESAEHGITFDLLALARDLQDEPSYLREGQAARTLVRAPDLRIVVVALRAGKRMAEHHANVTASVQTLTGHLRLQLADRSAELPAGQLIVLGAGLPHDVYAETDSTFVLTLGWSAAPSEGSGSTRAGES